MIIEVYSEPGSKACVALKRTLKAAGIKFDISTNSGSRMAAVRALPTTLVLDEEDVPVERFEGFNFTIVNKLRRYL